MLIVISAFIFIAVLFVRYLIASDRGHKEPLRKLWGAFGFGLFGVALATCFEGIFVSRDIVTAPGNFPLSQIAFTAIAIGIIEEACKFVPLAIYAYKRSYFDEHTDGVFYFAIAGLGFGLPENILYSLGYGTTVGLQRLVLVLFFHAATTAIAGYYLSRHKLDHTSRLSVLLAVLAAMAIHALYDFGLLSGRAIFVLVSLVVTTSLTVYLFVLLRRSAQADVLAGLSSKE